jgi:hypothetical protein
MGVVGGISISLPPGYPTGTAYPSNGYDLPVSISASGSMLAIVSVIGGGSKVTVNALGLATGLADLVLHP